jgi:signal peptidase II
MRAPAASGRPQLLFVLVASGALALDQAAKLAAVALLDPTRPLALLGGALRLTLTHNTGGAFGLLPGGWFHVVASALISGVILAYVFTGHLAQGPGRALPLGLIVGGALGNLLDRLQSGAVTDFIDLQVWPVFNVADIGITVGVALLALELIRRRR